MYYATSNYQKAIKEDVRTVKMDCKISLTNGITYNFVDKEILRGSLYINKRCVSKDDLELGCLYASEMGISIKYSGNAYNFQDAIISPKFSLYIEEISQYESIPLGNFKVSGVERKNNYVQLTAMDDILKFDKTVPTSEYSYNEHYDKPYSIGKHLGNFIIWCCEKCDVPTKLKVANFDSYPGNAMHGIDVEYKDLSNITYRDFLSSSLQLLGLFGYIDTQGYFCVRSFDTDYRKVFTPRDRYSLSSNDYEVCSIGFSYEGVYSGINTYSVELSNNLFLEQMEYNQTNSPIIGSILNKIFSSKNNYQTLSYVPCTMEYPGDPTIDVGDMIRIEPIMPSLNQKFKIYRDLNGHKGSELNGLIFGQKSDYGITPFNALVMEHNWVYRGKCTIRSFGKNIILRKIYRKK